MAKIKLKFIDIHSNGEDYIKCESIITIGEKVILINGSDTDNLDPEFKTVDIDTIFSTRLYDLHI